MINTSDFCALTASSSVGFIFFDEKISLCFAGETSNSPKEFSSSDSELNELPASIPSASICALIPTIKSLHKRPSSEIMNTKQKLHSFFRIFKFHFLQNQLPLILFFSPSLFPFTAPCSFFAPTENFALISCSASSKLKSFDDGLFLMSSS